MAEAVRKLEQILRHELPRMAVNVGSRWNELEGHLERARKVLLVPPAVDTLRIDALKVDRHVFPQLYRLRINARLFRQVQARIAAGTRVVVHRRGGQVPLPPSPVHGSPAEIDAEDRASGGAGIARRGDKHH